MAPKKKKTGSSAKASAKAKTTANAKSTTPVVFPFMKLPTEIRHMVLKYTFERNNRLIHLCWECDECHSSPMCHDLLSGWDSDGTNLDQCPRCHSEECFGECFGECKVKAIQVTTDTDPPEPGLLQIACLENQQLYREALPFYYHCVTINVEVGFAKEDPLGRFFSALDDNHGRSKMLRHLHMYVQYSISARQITSWIRAREGSLSAACNITFSGNKYMVKAFVSACRMGERMRKHGLDWNLVEASMKDLEDVMDLFLTGCSECLEDGYEDCRKVHQYAELVLAQI